MNCGRVQYWFDCSKWHLKEWNKHWLGSTLWHHTSKPFTSGSTDHHSVAYIVHKIKRGIKVKKFFTRMNFGLVVIHSCIATVLFVTGGKSQVCRIHTDKEEIVWYLRLGYLMGFSECVTAMHHFMVETFLRHNYYTVLRCRWNPFRWVEYSITAPCVFTTIHCIAGNTSITSMIASAFLIHTTMYYGVMSELCSRPMVCLSATTWSRSFSTRIVPHLLGYVPCAAAWIQLSLPVLYGTMTFTIQTKILIFIELIEFFAFAFTQLVFLRLPPVFYVHAEYIYCILSLFSKTTVATYILFII